MTALGASPCAQENDAAVICSDPTCGPLTGSRISLPIIICIILGALLCVLLALLVWQARSARAGRGGSESAWEPFPDAVYEEIGYSQAWEKQPRFSGKGVPVPPGGDPADGYDDAGEVSDPGEDRAPGQGDWELPRAPEEGAGPGDAPGESTGYDDAEEVPLAHPPEDTKAASPELGAEQSLSPGAGEPVPAVELGAAWREERTVQLAEP
ncbi:antigen WC1.1-like isoform X2 [Phalacrocorax carbo]|uniref:antigen WC1.1-like isoform X2 n=1 Tax=Phalacrocorax carbo TaxID=9209 RepID=UPI00311A3EE2